MLTVPPAQLGGAASGQAAKARPPSHIRIRLWGERVGESWQYKASSPAGLGRQYVYGPAPWWLMRWVVRDLLGLQRGQTARALEVLLGSGAVRVQGPYAPSVTWPR